MTGMLSCTVHSPKSHYERASLKHGWINTRILWIGCQECLSAFSMVRLYCTNLLKSTGWEMTVWDQGLLEKPWSTGFCFEAEAI